jgi:tRNA dimethylallyltransferase
MHSEIERLASFPQPLFIAGPTAVGKSEVALLLAEKLRGEIISVDSMQVYRGMNIGTAKPSSADRARVTHHLIDVMDLAETFDAARFVELARTAVTEIEARGHRPIFCGGTGLYFKAFLEGLGDAPASSPVLRAELEATPLSELLQELAEHDPETFEKIDRQNSRRVIRALEVIRLTGKRFSEQRAAWSARAQINTATSGFFCLARPVEDLRFRINARVEEMFRRGLVDETDRLSKLGLPENRTAAQALGYKQVLEHLHGERSLTDTIELVKVRTRQFAKRQMTWFRRQTNASWIMINRHDPPAAVAEQIATQVP